MPRSPSPKSRVPASPQSGGGLTHDGLRYGPNEAHQLIATLLGEPGRVVLAPYLLGASARVLAVLNRPDLHVLPPGRLPLLAVLDARPGISQVDLARMLGIERATAGEKIKECLALDLVTRERDPADARRFSLALSAKGRRLVRKAVEMSERQEAEIGAGLSEEERAMLVGLLRKVMGQDVPAR